MKITVDLMNRDNIYLGTMRIEPSLQMITDYYKNKPVVSVRELCREVEERRPTLRGKDYRLLPCNDKFVFNQD